jgi:hypothetical protein
MGSRGRGNKSSQSQIQARRRRLTKLMGKGVSTGEAEIVLQREGFRGTDRVTLDRDLKAFHQRWAECNPEEFEKLREVQLRILERMEEFLLAEKIDLETAREWRAIRQDISKLLGLNREVAPTVQVNIETDPARLGLYDRFMQATRWVRLAKFQLIWDFIRSIEEPPTGELTRSMLPPADSELWHDDEEPKRLLEGATKTSSF